MKYAILFSSHSGNTRAIAEAIRQALKDEECICFEQWQENAVEADVLFVGSWTDKGNFDEHMQEVLRKLHHKKIALFGTAGFGGSSTYFDTIMQRVKTSIACDNTILGTFMCQGRMPSSVRNRYEAMLKKQPDDKKTQSFIDNFDQALAHPSEQDLLAAKAFAHNMIEE